MLEPTIHLIDTPDALAAHRETIAATHRLGVDTEFVRERTYYPRPGLLQVSDGAQVWLLDPVPLADCAEFADLISSLMRDRGVTKILHSTGEDLEVLDLLAGGPSPPDPLFDTQRAAALLGWPLQVRYEVLAHDLLGVEFPGGLGRNNWLRRPLPAAWVDYAAHDVIGLPAMRDDLVERLEKAGRLAWLEEDCARIRQRGVDDDQVVSRIRGAAGLDDEQLAVLAGLARWREGRARARDLPRGFVVRDESLLELVRAAPNQAEGELASLRGLSKSDRAEILDLLERPPADFSRPPELEPLTREQRAQIKDMQRAVRAVAESLGVEPPLLASKRDLTRLLQTGSSELMTGWRGELLPL